ncbi:hypothetical protein BU16DRAFT_589269 [Lophium mytilinum]|uniref:Zn(2)-C6 fungal-type domain-containing protein n=1 Tax=Lophium mytilinum TaxID=390894 RepID=A0A6A6QQZ6_9PEZI|nr:hypothetical protein BU16DRAFT_589269 [Lophium mytilinum]
MIATSRRSNQEGQAKRACLSCRRQRRWCDRMLPNCVVCTKAGRQCEGYGAGAIRTFVNLNASNVSTTNKKRLLCDAIAEMKELGAHEERILKGKISTFPSHAVPPFGREELGSLHIDYPQQVAALWSTFILGYCQTSDYWPPGCSRLMLRNKALDLSIVALSAQRLALNQGNAALHIMSLTAYNNSIGLYRGTVQKSPNSGLAAMLAVTSTVYALVDSCLSPPIDMANFSWGSSGHFDGALALMRQSGPDEFAKNGFHLVFKKIREMGFFLALTRRQKTFLSKDKWMRNPWTSQPKTWRDKLYDLALRFTSQENGLAKQWVLRQASLDGDLRGSTRHTCITRSAASANL